MVPRASIPSVVLPMVLLLTVLTCFLPPLPVVAQDIPPEVLAEAVRRTGLSEEELLRF